MITWGFEFEMRSVARSWRERAARMSAAIWLLAGAALLSACSPSSLPPSLGGLPQNFPERPAVQPAYPAVHDMPPPRGDATLSAAEKKKLKDDLIASRERAELRAGVKKPEKTSKSESSKKPDSTDTGDTQSAGAVRSP